MTETLPALPLEVIHRGWNTFGIATLTLPDGSAVRRALEDHGQAACVLPYDPERRVALLVRQARVGPAFWGESAEFDEAPAGGLDGDAPEATAIREAMEANAEGGGLRGGSGISQQVAKNAFLWQGRSWVRKGLEAGFTVLVEAIWPKRRILEVYLSVAEMGEGIFGLEAAAQRHFGVSAPELSGRQAALIAAALPDPKQRAPGRPSGWLQRRAAAIESGAGTLEASGGGCVLD